MIKSEPEVQSFLDRFMTKTDVWGIVYLNRDKNLSALTRLGIVPNQRKEIIRSIVVNDYVETLSSANTACEDLWVFGKQYNESELYIKITIGFPDSNTVCVSFHEAEFPIKYAFK